MKIFKYILLITFLIVGFKVVQAQKMDNNMKTMNCLIK